MARHKRERNARKKKSFEHRYGMTAKEWAIFKRTQPKEEVVKIREKAKKMLL